MHDLPNSFMVRTGIVFDATFGCERALAVFLEYVCGPRSGLGRRVRAAGGSSRTAGSADSSRTHSATSAPLREAHAAPIPGRMAHGRRDRPLDRQGRRRVAENRVSGAFFDEERVAAGAQRLPRMASGEPISARPAGRRRELELAAVGELAARSWDDRLKQGIPRSGRWRRASLASMASCILVTRDHVEAVLPHAALSRSSWSYGIGYRVLVYVVDGDTCLLRSKRVVGISVVESHVAGHHHPPVDGPEKVVESLALNRKMHRPKVEVATALDGQPRTDDRSSGADFVRRPRSWEVGPRLPHSRPPR